MDETRNSKGGSMAGVAVIGEYAVYIGISVL